MPTFLLSKLKPNGSGTFPVADACDIEMPDGTRLSEFRSVYPVVDGDGVATLQPETYYTFDEVSHLSVILDNPADNLAHEFTFEFIPTEDFDGLTVTPPVSWVAEPQYPAGKTVQVSILRGIGVMACA